mgnify:CR=1 FL=1
MRGVHLALSDAGSDDLGAIGVRLHAGDRSARRRIEAGSSRTTATIRAPSLQVPGRFLELAGIVLGGAQLARAALIASRNLGNGNGSGNGGAGVSARRRSRPRATSQTIA